MGSESGINSSFSSVDVTSNVEKLPTGQRSIFTLCFRAWLSTRSYLSNLPKNKVEKVSRFDNSKQELFFFSLVVTKEMMTPEVYLSRQCDIMLYSCKLSPNVRNKIVNLHSAFLKCTMSHYKGMLSTNTKNVYMGEAYFIRSLTNSWDFKKVTTILFHTDTISPRLSTTYYNFEGTFHQNNST